MWRIKTFKTAQAMQNWVTANEARAQWHEVFINNGYAVQFRPLRVIG